MKAKDYLKLISGFSKIALGLITILLVGTNGFQYTQAYFTTNLTATSLNSQTGYWANPTVSLLSLNGGQSLYQGNNYSIIWSAQSSDPSAAVSINLYYSTDGGATYPNIISAGEVNDGIYSWTVPNIFSSSVRIKVLATDSHGLSNFATSNSNLSIISPIVLNEFLPNPAGADDAAKPNGEWVELYNNGKVNMDVNGWVIYDALNHALPISATNSDNNGNPNDAGETVVPAGGFLVVYKNATGNFSMNNTGGDTVKLYNGTIASGATLIDSHSYTLSPVPDNKSFARIPDGTGAWVDPDPTPGKPNVTTDNYLLLPENQPLVIQNTQTPTPTPSLSPSPSPTETATPVPTESASPTPTASPTDLSSPTPDATATPVPSPSPEPTTSPNP